MNKLQDFDGKGFSESEIRTIKSVYRFTGMSLNYIAECMLDFKSIGYKPKAGEIVRYIKYKLDGFNKFKNENGRRVPWTKEDYLKDSIIK